MIETPGILWTILFFIVAIGPLVFLHEMGHYLVGRWFGVKADVFSIGFGREVAGWTDARGTRWKTGWLPLGGYVKFAGDLNGASVPDPAWQALPAAERDRTFQSKPLWQRALIVAAGPFTNFLIGFAIFAGLAASLGDMRVSPQIGDVRPASAAERAGLRTGDVIKQMDGHDIDDFQDLLVYVYARPKVPITFEIDRAGTRQRVVATPAYAETRDQFGNLQRRGLLGIGPSGAEVVQVPLVEAPGVALSRVAGVVASTVDGIGQMIFGNLSAKEMSGPVKMAKFSGQIASMGLIAFLGFVAFVSINLGFINLLPIPMLDGGHLLLYGIEGVTRRPLPEAAQEWAFRGGFAAVLALMVFVTFNDLS